MDIKTSEYYDSLYIIKLIKDVGWFDIFDKDNLQIALSELKAQSDATSHIKYDFSSIRKTITEFIIPTLTSDNIIKHSLKKTQSSDEDEIMSWDMNEEVASVFEETKRFSCIKHCLDNYSELISFDVSELKDIIDSFYEWFKNYNCIRLVPFNAIRKYYASDIIQNHYSDTFVFLTKYSDLPESIIEDQAIMSVIQEDSYPKWNEINQLIVNDEALNSYYQTIQTRTKENFNLDYDNHVIELFFNICDEERTVKFHANEILFGKSFIALCAIHSDYLILDDLMLACICSPISYQERLDYINRIIPYIESTMKNIGPTSELLLKFIKRNDAQSGYSISNQIYSLWRQRMNEVSEMITDAGMTEYAAALKLSKRLRLRSKLTF